MFETFDFNYRNSNVGLNEELRRKPFNFDDESKQFQSGRAFPLERNRNRNH
jgi:hypothetical protein